MIQRFSACTLLAVGFATLLPAVAHAVPSFSAQTGQPCSACHVGGNDAQLKPYGRNFKLHGYVESNKPADDVGIADLLSVQVQGSFNRTDKDFPPSPGGVGYGRNDNFSFDQASLYYGGQLTEKIGMLQELTYDGANRNFYWDKLDLRHSFDNSVFNRSYTAGWLVSNELGNTSLWNSGTPNNFPYYASRIAPMPAARTLFDDHLEGQIMGGGLYGLWDDTLYGEVTVYVPLAQNFQRWVGTTGTLDNQFSNLYQGVIPYWHFGLQSDFGGLGHYAQIGTYGAIANRNPGDAASPYGDKSAEATDHVADMGFEANYQYLADPANIVSFHATYLHEKQDLSASRTLFGSNPSDDLNKFNADVSYSIYDTYIPSLGYFKTTGTRDAAFYTGAGSPNSEGYTLELAYVPFGKADSYVQNANLRLALDYTGYTQFDGSSRNASDNNTLFLNLSMALEPFATTFGK